MKKLILLITIPLVLCSCGQKSVKNENNTSNKTEQVQSDGNTKQVVKEEVKEEIQGKASDYYPFTKNTEYKYEGTGSEYASKDIYPDFIEDNKMQLRIITSGTTSVNIIGKTENEVSLVYSKGEVYHRENCIQKEFKGNKDILIKSPIKVGNIWTTSSGDKRSITAINKDIETKIGKLKALEIKTEGKNGTTLDYYVKDIGHVKSIYEDKQNKGLKVITEIKEINKDKAITEEIKFNYIKSTDTDFIRKTQYINVNFKTNEDIRKVFEKNLKNPPVKGLIPCFTKNVKINEMGIKNEGKISYIDLSQDFIKDMNAGASLEGDILNCVAYTIGNYYNTSEVLLTVNNKPYESGHIIFKNGETIKLK